MTDNTLPTNPDCAWCGGECFEQYNNRRGEIFCSIPHRNSSNRALKRLLDSDTTPEWGSIRNSDWKWIVNKVQEQADTIEAQSNALVKILQSASANGEDVSFLIAKKALHY